MRAFDVYCAPDTARSSRGETNGVADVVNSSTDAVNPTEAQRFIDGLRPIDTRFTGILFVETNEQLRCGVMVSCEPLAKIGGCFEKLRLQLLTAKTPRLHENQGLEFAAASPQHSAVRLRLTEPGSPFVRRLRLQFLKHSLRRNHSRAGKAKPFRTVRRQSRTERDSLVLEINP